MVFKKECTEKNSPETSALPQEWKTQTRKKVSEVRDLTAEKMKWKNNSIRKRKVKKKSEEERILASKK